MKRETLFTLLELYKHIYIWTKEHKRENEFEINIFLFEYPLKEKVRFEYITF